MPNRRLGWMIVAMLALWFTPMSFAQTSSSTSSTGTEKSKASASYDPRDVSGVWNGSVRLEGEVAPMLPEAQKIFDANTAEAKKGLPITTNPAFRCEPAGVPHAYQNGAFPFEIVQTPGRIFVFYESAHNWRTIWMDGREAPQGGDPLWMGYSVGRWEGNDLVVDTTGFNDRTWLDSDGHPHSEALHVVERFRRADRDTLTIEITINDPKDYARPWTVRGSYKLKPTWQIGEAYCVPSDQDNFEKHILVPNAKP